MNAKAVTVAACVLLGAAAVVSHAIGDGASKLVGTVALAQPLATAIPLAHAGWKGEEEPLAPDVLATTKVNDYVRRRYSDGRGNDVMLYVAYHGNKERGMQTYYHNATVCFRSQGWALESERTGTETLSDRAQEVPVCRYVFGREGARLSVMTFFKVNKELLDQSPRNKPFWTLIDRAMPQLDDSPGTFVQVQVIVPVGAGGEFAAADVQSRFLRDFGAEVLAAVDARPPE